jgi:hypothetical protein
MKRALSVAAVALCGMALSTARASALPTFAKAYGVQCSVCHTVPPQLNAYGRYVQRTGYAALERSLVNTVVPLTVAEEGTYDSGNTSQKWQAGNLAVHAAGYLAPDVTYHIHQWIQQNNQAGGLDTFQFAYSGLFKQNGHLFAGKLSALPVPGPFSNQSDIAPYAAAEMQVGEHMYQQDMMRWGAAFSYAHANLYLQAGWLGSAADLGGASDFSNNTDKTFEWIAAYADPNRPLEAGLYGSIGSWPLTEGGVDHYNTIAAYVQRDPGPHFLPGILALYQWGYDANPGIATGSGMGMGAAPSALARLFGFAGSTPIPIPISPMPMPSPSMIPMLPPAHSRTETFEVWEPVFWNRGIVALRQEMTNDSLGNVVNGGNIDFDIRPFRRFDYLHLYTEAALIQNSKPAWRGGIWFTAPMWPGKI